MVVTATTPGVSGNSIATTETITGSWGAVTLEGGVDNETITIGSKVYTLQAELSDMDGNVLIGADAAETIDNLIAAINLDAGASTLYAGSTTPNIDVIAAAGAGDTMTATARLDGEAANAVATTTTMADGAWGDETLVDGVDGETITIDDVTYKFQEVLTDEPGNILAGATLQDTLDNLGLAVTQMDDTGSGTLWAASTPPHPTVKALARDSDTLPLMVREAGDPGNSKTISTNAANGTVTPFVDGNSSNLFTATDHGLESGDGPFGVTTEGTIATPLAEGAAYFVHVVDENLIGLAGSREHALEGNLIYPTDPGMGDHVLTRGTTKESIWELHRTHTAAQIMAATDIDSL